MNLLKSRTLIVLVLVSIWISVCASTAFAGSGIELPEYDIVSLPSDTPEPVKILVGKWEGAWNYGSGPDAILIVEAVDLEKKEALCIYAWSDYAPHRIKAGYARTVTKLTLGEKPQLIFGNKAKGIQFKFVLTNSSLKGVRTQGSNYSRIKMKKID